MQPAQNARADLSFGLPEERIEDGRPCTGGNGALGSQAPTAHVRLRFLRGPVNASRRLRKPVSARRTDRFIGRALRMSSEHTLPSGEATLRSSEQPGARLSTIAHGRERARAGERESWIMSRLHVRANTRNRSRRSAGRGDCRWTREPVALA